MAVAAGQGWGCEEEEATVVGDEGDESDSLRSECAEDPPWMRLLFAREAPQSFEKPEGARGEEEEAECAATEAYEEDWAAMLLRRRTTRTTAADDDFEEAFDALARDGAASCPSLNTLAETACMFERGMVWGASGRGFQKGRKKRRGDFGFSCRSIFFVWRRRASQS